MLQLGVHRFQILKQQLDRIHLLLAADRCDGLGGRRSHGRRIQGGTLTLKASIFPGRTQDKLPRETQASFTLFVLITTI